MFIFLLILLGKFVALQCSKEQILQRHFKMKPYSNSMFSSRDNVNFESHALQYITVLQYRATELISDCLLIACHRK